MLIFDEVYSYDTYADTILDRVVEELRKLHCTVIILSATLIGERRSALLGAAKARKRPSAHLGAGCRCERTSRNRAETPGVNDVAILLTLDIDEAQDEALDGAESGQQVLWIEYTISETQEALILLAARSSSMKFEGNLLHSRFIHANREALEKEWVMRYGIQMLEHLLIIDADFIVTHLCPAEM
ncbi:MAG: hypothetical protein HGB15_05450 [Chlorobaculum sp.]|nr:hypothetical protein [Chlorobaculum sp.]